MPKEQANADEKLPAKLPGSFSFLENRPFDLIVVLKTTDNGRQLRTLQLYYAEMGRLSSFQYTASDPRYAHDYSRFSQAAIRGLLKEVNSRHLAHDEFAVWFFSEEHRRLVENLCSAVAEGDAQLLRALELLVSYARLVDSAGGTQNSAS